MTNGAAGTVEARPTIPPDAVRRQLELVLASRQFANSARLRRFLQFTVEKSIAGEGDRLKEYPIGIEVFDRPEGFDPRTDSVVRVEARRVREKLGEYYREEGAAADPILISLPKGSYVPTFELRVPPAAARRLARRLWVAAGVAALGGLLITLWALWRAGLFSAQPVATIAVLPFDNLSPERDGEFFAHGLTEELTAALSGLGRVRVVARASALQLKARRAEWPELPRKLGVGMVVEGSVRRSGQRYRIVVQLVSVDKGYGVWSETYERELHDAFQVQDEIARAVTQALRLGSAPARTAREPANAEARLLYWRGQYTRNQRSPEALRSAAELFEQAAAKDPRHAMSWAGMAEAYATLAFHQTMPVEQAMAKARRAVETALRLDPSLAEAHTTLAWIAFFRDHNWPAAERGFRRALDLNPSYAGAHQLYAIGLLSRRRFDEAIAASRRALELNPLYYLASNELAVTLLCGRQYDEAIRVARRSLELEPGYSPAQILVAIALTQKREFTRAFAQFEKALASRRDSDILGRYGHSLALGGRAEEARKIAAEMEELFGRGEPTWIHLAFVYSGLGDRDHAFTCLEKSLARGETDLNFLDADPTWDPIRQDPRFERLRKRLGLAE